MQRPHHAPLPGSALAATVDRRFRLYGRDLRWIAGQLEAWYPAHARDLPWRGGGLPEWVALVCEVLLQQTPAARVAALLPVIEDVFGTPARVAATTVEALEGHLRPLGLHRRRARALHALAVAVLARGDVPRDRVDLLRLPGVGPYVCNAFLSAARGYALPGLDVNFARVIERTTARRILADVRSDPWLDAAAHALTDVASDPRALNWAILDLGALVCHARAPSCAVCPLLARCRWARRRGTRAAGGQPGASQGPAGRRAHRAAPTL